MPLATGTAAVQLPYGGCWEQESAAWTRKKGLRWVAKGYLELKRELSSGWGSCWDGSWTAEVEQPLLGGPRCLQLLARCTYK